MTNLTSSYERSDLLSSTPFTNSVCSSQWSPLINKASSRSALTKYHCDSGKKNGRTEFKKMVGDIAVQLQYRFWIFWIERVQLSHMQCSQQKQEQPFLKLPWWGKTKWVTWGWLSYTSMGCADGWVVKASSIWAREALSSRHLAVQTLPYMSLPDLPVSLHSP